MEGAKMSKSFGNIIPLREALAKFGADPVRLSVLATAELLQDADFSPSVAKSMRDRLERLYKLVEENSTRRQKKTLTRLSPAGKWILSRLQGHIEKATEAMDKLAVRKMIHTAMYEMDQNFEWYQKRTSPKNEKNEKDYITTEFLDAQVRMLAPVAPHVCEEMWEMMGGKDSVSASPWPTVDKAKIDLNAEENETLIVSVLEDVQNIAKATGRTPKKVYLYAAAPWKWKIYLKILEKSTSAKITQKDVMKELMADAELKKEPEKTAKFASQIIDEANRTPDEKKHRLLQLGKPEENNILEEARNFLGKELDAEIHVSSEDDKNRYDPKSRATIAKPYRPAIYIE
jgi:leucyl-tRNA synthetase